MRAVELLGLLRDGRVTWRRLLEKCGHLLRVRVRVRIRIRGRGRSRGRSRGRGRGRGRVRLVGVGVRRDAVELHQVHPRHVVPG